MGDRKSIPFPIGKFELIVVIQGINHPGNLGAIARTMMNYGFKNLRLVSPNCSIDDEETRIRAKHSGLVLDSCEIYDSLEDSFHDVNLVVGTSGKREVGSKTSLRHFTFVWDLYDIFSNWRKNCYCFWRGRKRPVNRRFTNVRHVNNPSYMGRISNCQLISRSNRCIISNTFSQGDEYTRKRNWSSLILCQYHQP